MNELLPFIQLRALLQQSSTTCKYIVAQCLQNIASGAHLNAFLRVYAEEAQQQAAIADQKSSTTPLLPLTGMVVGLKDLLCYQDHPVQAASKILEGFISQFSATAVQRLVDQGGIIIGHQNCDQFGMGSSNENSAFGPVHNALDTTRVSGGSSGGSAVAVQAHMCHVSLGTDTGGSVRQPAAFCGLVGLKPTYGRISRHGLIAYASSFDTIGILAQDVQACAAMLEVIAGPDTFDSTVSQQPVPAYTKLLQFDSKAKVAYLPAALAHAGLQPAIRSKTQAVLSALRRANHQVEAVDFPLLDYALPAYYVLVNAEASSNLARFDGVRYGYRSSEHTTIAEMYRKTRTQGFGQEVQRRILTGTFVLSADYYDAWYVKAQKVRRLIKEQLEAILTTYDFIVLPTTPTTAFKIGTYAQDPLAMYLADLYTVLASIAGIPAISIPNGTDEEGLPIGLQVMAPAFGEAKLLAFADYLATLVEGA
ncbi:MAG: Asp-tRNA(Asn)/Glu-tRNA(Gln) amidotransferase subunit GatA [Bacteroidota bacterium]